MANSKLRLIAPTSACVVMGSFGMAGDAVAVTFTDTYTGFANTNDPGSTFSRTITVDPTASGDGLFTLSAFGDFNVSSEWVSVSIEDFVLGAFLDNNPGNDLFDNLGFADVGTQYQSVSTASVVIPLAILTSIISDGLFTITYTLGSSVDNLSNSPEEFLTASMGVAPVPVPAALPLFGTGIAAMGLMGWWRRRRSAAVHA